MDKGQIRTEILKRRNDLPTGVREGWSAAITDIIRAGEAWQRAEVIMGYASFGSEVDSFPLLRVTLQAGKTLVLPKVNRRLMNLSLLTVSSVDDDLEKGAWGIPEPREECCPPMAAEKLDLILIPGVAFDLYGGRIGYGKGFYDRLLRNLRAGGSRAPAVGVAFQLQVVERIPLEAHDVLIDGVVTEEGYHPRRPLKS